MEGSNVVGKNNVLEIISNLEFKTFVDIVHLFVDHSFDVWIEVRTIGCGMSNGFVSFANFKNSHDEIQSKLRPHSLVKSYIQRSVEHMGLSRLELS